jgi:hypothetical protein
MAKQATDLEFSINNMLMFLRGAGTLLEDMETLVDAHNAAAAANLADSSTTSAATSL